ncbi:hypothetical protein PV325_009622 [Microctonus aethiopoides]|nr:hypothetical protein PV326_014367 [Microctonus aethiopoides]KAK0073498.1 hypothetical protein PV325_009622 [Microctonus aethiopoides]
MDNGNSKSNKPSLPGPSLDQEEKATEPGAGKPRVRYSGAARRRFRKEQRKLGAEQALGTSALELRDGGKAARKRREVNALRLSTTPLALSPGGQIKDLSWPLEPLPRRRRR